VVAVAVAVAVALAVVVAPAVVVALAAPAMTAVTVVIVAAQVVAAGVAVAPRLAPYFLLLAAASVAAAWDRMEQVGLLPGYRPRCQFAPLPGRTSIRHERTVCQCHRGVG
jgi:hypothetical protein